MRSSCLDPDLNKTTIKLLFELIRKIWYVPSITSQDSGIAVMFFFLKSYSLIEIHGEICMDETK